MKILVEDNNAYTIVNGLLLKTIAHDDGTFETDEFYQVNYDKEDAKYVQEIWEKLTGMKQMPAEEVGPDIG